MQRGEGAYQTKKKDGKVKREESTKKKSKPGPKLPQYWKAEELKTRAKEGVLQANSGTGGEIKQTGEIHMIPQDWFRNLPESLRELGLL